MLTDIEYVIFCMQVHRFQIVILRHLSRNGVYLLREHFKVLPLEPTDPNRLYLGMSFEDDRESKSWTVITINHYHNPVHSSQQDLDPHYNI